jgi:hypothetical protein
LFIVWSIVLVVFFSVSQSKRPDYILTVVVALGALTGRVFDSALARGRDRAARLVLRGVVLLAIVSAVTAALLGASALKAQTGEPFLMLPGELSIWLTPVHLPVTCGLIVVALAAGVARWRGNLRAAFAAFLLLPLIVVAVGFRGFARYAESKSTRTLANRIPELPSNTEIVCWECFPTGVPLYLKRFVTVVTDGGKELRSNYIVFMLKKATSWPKGVVRLSESNRWLATRGHPVYLIAHKNRLETIKSLAAQHGATVAELEPGWWGALLPAATSQ